jgi:flagellar hook-basal body complex protein FliE
LRISGQNKKDSPQSKWKLKAFQNPDKYSSSSSESSESEEAPTSYCCGQFSTILKKKIKKVKESKKNSFKQRR